MVPGSTRRGCDASSVRQVRRYNAELSYVMRGFLCKAETLLCFEKLYLLLTLAGRLTITAFVVEPSSMPNTWGKAHLGFLPRHNARKPYPNTIRWQSPACDCNHVLSVLTGRSVSRTMHRTRVYEIGAATLTI